MAPIPPCALGCSLPYSWQPVERTRPAAPGRPQPPRRRSYQPRQATRQRQLPHRRHPSRPQPAPAAPQSSSKRDCRRSQLAGVGKGARQGPWWRGHRAPCACRTAAAELRRPQDQAGTAFSRLRCTEDGMRSASRYLATVRRAMSTPSCRNRSTIASSDRTASGVLRADHARGSASAPPRRCALAAMGAGDGGGEEILQLEGAARRRDVLVGGDAADGAFVHLPPPRRCRAGSAAAGSSTPWRKKPSCRRTISLRDLEDGVGALLQALHQPVGALQLLRQEDLVVLACGADLRSGRRSCG